MSANPKHIGPGYWANWHTTSLKAKDSSTKALVAKNIVFAIDNFPCQECKKDFIKYIKANSLKSAVQSKDPLSMFKWTVNSHNYVNQKLGKTILHWTEAKDAWEGKQGLCFENCGLSEDEIKKDEIKKDEEIIEIVIKSY